MDTEKKVTLVVTIPAYNESATIAEVIEAVPNQIEGIDKIDVVVIDDGSGDDTAARAKAAGAAKVVSFTHNRGLGAAFNQGVKIALGLGA
ncbi:MAG: glycosyltransferase, partial [Planctomycetes bacterium]|nr:glycosyltransferase [Planctomycetota bacterium]